MEPVTRMDVMLFTGKNFPAVVVRLPDFVVAEIPHLLEAAKVLNPAATAEDVVRGIVRLGIRNLRNQLQAQEPIDIAKLPGPQPKIKLPSQRPVNWREIYGPKRAGASEAGGGGSGARPDGGEGDLEPKP